LPAHQGCVVIEVVGGALSHVGCLDEYTNVGDGTGQLQIAVGDGSLWILEQHQGVADSLWEFRKP